MVKKNSVFCVWTNEGDNIRAIFSTRKKAEKYIENNNELNRAVLTKLALVKERCKMLGVSK